MKKELKNVGIVIALMAILSMTSCKKEKTENEPIRSNQSFITQAASSNRFEIEAGGLALQKSQHAEVRDFAEDMIADHTAAGLEMRALATRKGWDVPSDLLPEDQQLLDRLSEYEGNTFDQEYARIMVLAHQKAVNLFENGKNTNGLDEDLKAWIDNKLPVLREHFSHARALDDALNP